MKYHGNLSTEVSTHPGPRTATRTDIQALRGLAVLLVVLHHARIDFLAAGYLGVDIFFVISGFLITGLVKAGIERGDFRFSEFYFRRAKRLLPAAYATFLVTALLAPFLLNSRELDDFAAQMIGAVTFTGNLVLWQQTGYFQEASELKPLLHVWSLAIEEQYYFVLPATLVFVAPRRWLSFALIVLVGSLVLCAVGTHYKPIATFYLLPTRGWELAIGSVGALISSQSRLFPLSRVFFLPALLVLLLIPLVSFGERHPGLDAVLVCTATLVVLLRRHVLLNRSAAAQLLARVGDFSYALYLVHWPIFAFANNAWAGEPPGELPAWVRMVAVMLSFALGYALYRYVEVPARRANLHFSGKLALKAVAASCGLIVITSGIARAAPSGADYALIRRTNYGFDQACEYRTRFVAKRECRNSERPSILVWGDSVAMHLVPGIVATSQGGGVVQATKSQCGPLLNIAPITAALRGLGTDFNRAWAETCVEFNQSVLDYLAATPSIDLVVLSSVFRQYLDGSEFLSLVRENQRFHVAPANADTAMAGLEQTVNAIRALGKRVIVVAPPPPGQFNIGACLERLADGKVLFGAPRDCRVPQAQYQEESAKVLHLLSQVPGKLDVAIFSFEPLLCIGGLCQTSIDGTFVYRDALHFSYDGSRLLAERADLARKLREMAR